jgi:hypothetical protein
MHGRNDRESKSGRAPLQVRANANVLFHWTHCGGVGPTSFTAVYSKMDTC